MAKDPAGQILHRGNLQEVTTPFKVYHYLVRRQRHQGILRLGQPLKSFRDSHMKLPVYGPDYDRSYLEGLGLRVKPGRPKA